MEYVYLTCLVIWIMFSAFKVYTYRIDVSKKKYARIITTRLSSQYVQEKRFKELYAYDNKAFNECNFLYDYFIEKADVFLNKKLDYSLYKSYENFFSAGIIAWIILLYLIPNSFHTIPRIIICIICAGCGMYSFYFYQCYYSSEVTYRDDPKYAFKRDSDRSSRWQFHVAEQVNANQNQIIKDAEELADLFY